MNLELPGFFSQEQLPTMLADSQLLDADYRLKFCCLPLKFGTHRKSISFQRIS
jgi:hypothetical protein